MKPIHIGITLAICLFSNLFSVAFAQTVVYNREVKGPGDNIKLLGKSTRDRLTEAPFGSWFNAGYAAYTVDTVTARQLIPLLQNKTFKIFMGTWCGDSRREVPRIYKLLDCCGVPSSSIELINVDNSDTAYKQSPTHEEKGLNIHRVPDLLVYENGKETGRVVEFPVESWEKDLLKILTGENYRPNYTAALFMDSLFRMYSLRKLSKRLPVITTQVKPLARNRFELQSLARVKTALHETARAFYLLRLNTRLFAEDAEAWNTLGDAYLQQSDTTRALAQFQKALTVQPGNEMAAAMLRRLTGDN